MPRTMKTFDDADPITGTVTADGTRVDLSVYETINFHFKVDGAAEFVGGEAVDVETVDGEGGTDPEDELPVTRGRFRYEQLPADIDTAATYEVELECILANGKKVHFPNRKAENDTITLDPDLSED